MIYTVLFQNTPERNRFGDFEANFVPLGTVRADSWDEAWKLARQNFPKLRYPVIELERI